MTHDELLAEIDFAIDDSKYDYDFNCADGSHDFMLEALRKVVELHKPLSDKMQFCMECKSQYNGELDVVAYPCPTIQAIERELQ